MIVLEVVAGYLVAGLLFLVLFNLKTKRVKENIDDVVAEAQIKINSASTTFNTIAGPAGQMPPFIAGKRMMIVILLATAWITWPLVLAGYFKSRRGEKDAE